MRSLGRTPDAGLARRALAAVSDIGRGAVIEQGVTSCDASAIMMAMDSANIRQYGRTTPRSRRYKVSLSNLQRNVRRKKYAKTSC